MLWLRPPFCATPNWMHPPASSWMLLTSPWELCCNSRSTRSGAQFPTFHGSCVQQRGGIAHSTGNYWPSTSPSAISATLWKVASSMYSPTTKHSLLLFPVQDPFAQTGEASGVHRPVYLRHQVYQRDYQHCGQCTLSPGCGFPTCGATLLCDTSTGVPCPLVPPQFRHQVFDTLHTRTRKRSMSVALDQVHP